jgi:hypothetical protein
MTSITLKNISIAKFELIRRKSSNNNYLFQYYSKCESKVFIALTVY